MRERSARDEDRMKTLDGKLATLLTGVVAAIGFSFRTTPTVVTVVTAMTYLVPLALIVRALTTKLAAHAPDPDSLERHFPSYPVSTMREAVKAIKASHDRNSVRYDEKANDLTIAFIATLLVTVVALTAQLLLALRVVHL